MKNAFVLVVLLLILRAFPAAAAPLAGHWAGTLTQQGAVLPVAFDFQSTGGAYGGDFTCPTQMCLQYPLDSVTETAHAVHFVLGGGMIFDGTLAGNALVGTFQNSGM